MLRPEAVDLADANGAASDGNVLEGVVVDHSLKGGLYLVKHPLESVHGSAHGIRDLDVFPLVANEFLQEKCLPSSLFELTEGSLHVH